MEPSITRQCGNLSVTGAKRAWRRQYLIDKKCQIAFAGNMLLIAGVCMLVTALTMSWFFVYFMEDHLSGDIDTLYLIKLGIILLFMAVGIVIWTVIRTHCHGRSHLQDPQHSPGRGPGGVSGSSGDVPQERYVQGTCRGSQPMS